MDTFLRQSVIGSAAAIVASGTNHSLKRIEVIAADFAR